MSGVPRPATSSKLLRVALAGGLVAVSLQISSSLTPLFVHWGPIRTERTPRPSQVALAAGSAAVGLSTEKEVRLLKQDLKGSPTEAAATALERLWQPKQAVADLRHLEGAWRLRGLKGNGMRGWMSGDMPRFLYDLYAGELGRMLQMELVGTPVLSIKPDGTAEMKIRLRWGNQRDEILMHSHLSVLAPNLLQEAPRTMQSKALKLIAPAMQRSRQIRITYLDSELMILRDSRGIVDLLWRNEAQPSRKDKAAPSPQESQGRPTPPALRHDGKLRGPKQEVHKVEPEASGGAHGYLDFMEAGKAVSVEAPNQVERLKSEVAVLQRTLEAHKNQSLTNKAEQQMLRAEVARLQKDLKSAAAGSTADTAKLNALTEQQDKVTEATELQQQKAEEQAKSRNLLVHEVTALSDKVEELQSDLTKFRHVEESLKQSITELKEDKGAKEIALAQLAEVQAELRAAGKAVVQLQKELSHKTGELREKNHAAEAALAAREKLEAQNELQRREAAEQEERLQRAANVEQALRDELSEVQARLRVVEEREAKSREIAAAVENNMREVAGQVSQARGVAKSLKTEERRRGLWGLFR